MIIINYLLVDLNNYKLKYIFNKGCQKNIDKRIYGYLSLLIGIKVEESQFFQLYNKLIAFYKISLNIQFG